MSQLIHTYKIIRKKIRNNLTNLRILHPYTDIFRKIYLSNKCVICIYIAKKDIYIYPENRLSSRYLCFRS